MRSAWHENDAAEADGDDEQGSHGRKNAGAARWLPGGTPSSPRCTSTFGLRIIVAPSFTGRFHVPASSDSHRSLLERAGLPCADLRAARAGGGLSRSGRRRRYAQELPFLEG